MPESDLRSLIFLLYEYLYEKGQRVEADFLRDFDLAYMSLFSSRAERFIDSDRMLKLVESKARFDSFIDIQKDIHDILSMYRSDK